MEALCQKYCKKKRLFSDRISIVRWEYVYYAYGHVCLCVCVCPCLYLEQNFSPAWNNYSIERMPLLSPFDTLRNGWSLKPVTSIIVEAFPPMLLTRYQSLPKFEFFNGRIGFLHRSLPSRPREYSPAFSCWKCALEQSAHGTLWCDNFGMGWKEKFDDL